MSDQEERGRLVGRKPEPLKPLVNMGHRPDGGEVQGMRQTMERFSENLVKHGATPEYAQRVAREQAVAMERRMGRSK